MKFWELIAIFREEENVLALLFRRPAWSQFAEWYRMYATHVTNQNRTVLDAKVPDDMCREALALSNQEYVIRNGQVMVYTLEDASAGRERLTSVDTFNRFGGSAIEEICESGGYIIPLKK